LAGQLFVRGTGDQQQESVVDVPHDGCGLKLLSSKGLISFWHTGSLFDSCGFLRAAVNLQRAVFGAAKKPSLVNSRRDFLVN
jgi:hypothetical protein